MEMEIDVEYKISTFQYKNKTHLINIMQNLIENDFEYSEEIILVDVNN